MSDRLLKERKTTKLKLNDQISQEKSKLVSSIYDANQIIKNEIEHTKHDIDSLNREPNVIDKEIKILGYKTKIEILEKNMLMSENDIKNRIDNQEIQMKNIKEATNKFTDKSIINNAFNVQIYNATMIGDIYKKYGALFFAVNLGDYSASVDSVDNGNFENQTTPHLLKLN